MSQHAFPAARVHQRVGKSSRCVHGLRDTSPLVIDNHRTCVLQQIAELGYLLRENLTSFEIFPCPLCCHRKSRHQSSQNPEDRKFLEQFKNAQEVTLQAFEAARNLIELTNFGEEVVELFQAVQR